MAQNFRVAFLWNPRNFGTTNGSLLVLLLLFIDSNRSQKSFQNNLLARVCFMAKTIIFIARGSLGP